jgi:hypothetical protein
VVNHQVAQLIVRRLVIIIGNHAGGLGVERATVVRAEHVDIVGGDVVIAQ